ncbi:lipoyl synthase domain protein, partial [Vibrio parahaemolyticus V-223/04]
TLLLLQ